MKFRTGEAGGGGRGGGVVVEVYRNRLHIVHVQR